MALLDAWELCYKSTVVSINIHVFSNNVSAARSPQQVLNLWSSAKNQRAQSLAYLMELFLTIWYHFWYFTIILPLSAVVESHPDNAHPDLRLDRPFPGLVEYVDALDLHTMTKQVLVYPVKGVVIITLWLKSIQWKQHVIKTRQDNIYLYCSLPKYMYVN